MACSKKARLWCFTNFNTDFDYKPLIGEGKSVRFLAYGLEVCPNTKRAHHQGFLYLFNPVGSIKNLTKLIAGAHFEICKGNLQSNEKYCSKEGSYTELGEKPDMGCRSDLNQVRDDIKDGRLTSEEVAMNNPALYHQYGRTLSKIEDICLRKKFRDFTTKGLWLFGATGSGKSERAFKDFNPATHYVVPNDNGWWDGYTGQETVIFDEFRGDTLKYAELLKFIDKYPMTVKRRCREPVPFLAKLVIITSALHPSKVYCNLDRDDRLDQLYRRIDIVKMEQRCSEVILDSELCNYELQSDDEVL